jgi:steroid 5-alpha reductase family enzyme
VRLTQLQPTPRTRRHADATRTSDSRPHSFGEQLWWWSFGLFAVGLGEWRVLWGTAFNSLILATVTVMTEQRMLTRWAPERAALYREYMRTTSPCIPWFVRA